jgi:hypothetical protein
LSPKAKVPNGDTISQATINRNSLQIFHETELGKVIEDSPTAIQAHLKLPFKYRTLSYVKKILAGKDVEDYAKEFRSREPRSKNFNFTEQINKDLVRTKILKSVEHLHQDVHRVLEFYCKAKAVNYCQGMIEVLMPFLLMK